MAKRNMGSYRVGGRHWTGQAEDRREGSVEVEIDVEAIVRQVGYRTLFNKTGKASFMKGAVVVRVKGDVTRAVVAEGEAS